MAAHRWTVRRLAVVVFGLLLTGCAEMMQRRLGRLDDDPPMPAPLLHIPDPPAATAPVLAQAARPGQPPIVQAKAEKTTNVMRAIYLKAAQRYQTMESYTMRLRRREVVGGKSRPEELILVKFRQEPWSVYFKWIGNEAKGREVIYVKGRPGNEIHTLTAAGDVLLLPAGQRFSINADSALVKAKSRYPISEAGLGTTIRKFGAILDSVEKGDPKQGTLKYLGPVKRSEFEEVVEGIEQAVPPQSDPLMPGGGKRWWYFDRVLGMPVLIITHDETGREVEYYCHDRIQTPAHLDDDDFNPDKLWGPRGK
jgi:Protein of unknown function (DUF1571)